MNQYKSHTVLIPFLKKTKPKPKQKNKKKPTQTQNKTIPNKTPKITTKASEKA